MAGRVTAPGTAITSSLLRRPLYMSKLPRIRKPIEAAQLRKHIPSGVPPRPTQRLLEPPAELLRIPTRLPIQPFPPPSQPRINPRPLEQHTQQLHRESPR